MEPRTFCDALNREAGDYLLATVLEDAAQGAQLLLCGGVPVWPEHPAACLEAQLPALQQVTASGVQTFGALRVLPSGSVQPRVWWSAAAVMWGQRWCGWQRCWVCLSAP